MQSQQPSPEANDWDDEVFADFVDGDVVEEPEIDPQQIDLLKSLLGGLPDAEEEAGSSPSAPPASISDVAAAADASGSQASQQAAAAVAAHVLAKSKAFAQAAAGAEEEAEPENKFSDPSEIKPAQLAMIASPELAEAFLDDAGRGMANLEQAVIDYETDNDREAALDQIKRELHTLKGASAVVGLADTSRYIHNVEDFVSEPHSSESTLDLLLDCVETLQRQVRMLKGQPEEPESAEVAGGGGNRLESTSEGEDTISVKGEQLDRLLDMLTALTMLDSRRGARVTQFSDIHANMSVCGNRIRDLERLLQNGTSVQDPTATLRSVKNQLNEVADDMSAIGRLMRDAYMPIGQEQEAVSNFIRQFRNALFAILRTPVSGLFRRLQRAALDAARIERKQVRLEVIGSDAGLERSVQERLLDPLMHIVRNAVGHGIETPDVRRAAGKNNVGTITLEAVSAPNMLTISIRDDGKGLDYDALRRKGIELGLLQDGRNASREELGKLIFRRGLSTRQEANEVAGRGVGMDVVANTLEKLHAWIEVDSTPGEGTEIRITVPLKSITEHALMMRQGEHLLAIPMQYVRSAEESKGDVGGHPSLAEALGLEPTTEQSDSDNVSLLVVERKGVGAVGKENTVSCVVDGILGPQEVVVRPLPALLRKQKLLSGVTLANNGEIAYVLNANDLSDQLAGISDNSDSHHEVPGSNLADSRDDVAPRALIVDDSLSVRNAVAAMFRSLGWETFDASDGMAGLERLRNESWSAVITDYDMPRLDGIGFIEGLRAKKHLKDVPVVMVSSREPEEMEIRAKAAGATHYITKPLTIETLERLVSQDFQVER